MTEENDLQTKTVSPIWSPAADCSVIVEDPRFGTPYTLKIESVTADAVIVRRDPPYEGMTVFVGKGTRKEPDHPTQGYDRPSMNLVVQNMTKHRHPALSMFKAAYAQMLSQNDQVRQPRTSDDEKHN